MNNIQFYNMIHERGVTATRLCLDLGCGRVHLTLVLNGKREGRHTWPKLRKALSWGEYECAFSYAERVRVRLVNEGHRTGGELRDSVIKAA